MKTGTMTSKDFLAGKTKDFFNQSHCDRCKGEIGVGRTMSWFNEDTICVERCGAKETELKHKLSKAGANVAEYEGCGFVPELTK